MVNIDPWSGGVGFMGSLFLLGIYNVFEGFNVTAQARYTLNRGDIIWAWGQNSTPQPGRGKFVPRPPFPAVHSAVTKWKELNSPRKIERDPQNIPAGI